MPRENKSRYALLGMLTYQPMSGYDMKKMSDHSIGHFWNENYGAIYPVLRRLEEEGLVTKVRHEQEGAPARNVYSITEDGRRVFEDWLRRPPDRMLLREELLLQVFFGQWTEPEVVLAKLEAEDRRCRQIIENLEGIRDHIDRGGDVPADAPAEMAAAMNSGAPYWRATVEYGLHYYAGIRRWCDETRKGLGRLIEEEER